MKEPVPERMPKPGLPAGRTYPFVSMRDLDSVPEVFIAGADEAGCTLNAQDEYISAVCFNELDDAAVPPYVNVQPISGGHGETVVFRSPPYLQLRATVLPGEQLRLRFEWEHGSRELTVERSAAGVWSGRFGALVPGKPIGKPLSRSGGECIDPFNSFCNEYVPERPECEHRADGAPEDAYYLCSMGSRVYRRPCPAGHAHGDPAGRCLPLCDANGGCASGRCEDFQGVEICKPAL